MNKKILHMPVCVILLVGCAHTSPIVPIGDGVYEMAGQSATAMSSAAAQRVKLIQKANEF